MSISLAPGSISDFGSCVRRELLTYVSYPSSKTAARCFAYPQFLIQDNQLTLLEDGAFPDNGCLPMVLSDTNPFDMSERFGDLVVMTVNDSSPNLNRNYPETEPSRFCSIINPSFQRGKSAVEFTALSRHPLSSLLMQVLDVQESVDLSRPLDHPLRLYSTEAEPQTNLALVSQTVHGRRRYYGPFECTCSDGEVTLAASSSFDMFIAGFNEETFDFSIELVNEVKEVATQFVDAEEFRRKFDAAIDKIDWISDADLLDSLGRISRLGEEPFTKSQMRALKSNILRCAKEDARIALTTQRRERMLSLLDRYEDWNALPAEIQAEAIEKADPEQLASYVLDDEHFRGFYDKVIENEQVRDRVERDKADYRKTVEEARLEADAALERKRAVQAELAEFEGELEAKKRELEQAVQEQTAQARRERDELTSQIEALSEQKEQLEEGKARLNEQLRRTVSDLSDEVAVSGKILESEMVKNIVAALNAPSADACEIASLDADGAPALLLHPDDQHLKPSEVVDCLEHSICELAGRDLTRNEIVNVMICLTQGYILTLAGLPGTGKTSLASIVAGALGLTNPVARRFAEISVERGWTSYKDFVGYYNPLTKETEKSNATAFDAFAALDREVKAGIEAGTVPPFFFLLDEANLSSIEHYWAPFLRACDSFRGTPLALSLGGNGVFEVPSYVRFIATVNFDHTTEELSQRFLDRSWVITLDPEELDIEGDGTSLAPYDFSAMPALTSGTLERVFGAGRRATMSVELRAKLKEVTDICAAHQRPVSPRSQKMVWNYACTADGLMDRSTAQSSYAPVDYAIAQKILPLISGTEENVEGLLVDLSNVGNLPVVKQRVDHMLEVGNGSGYYQYFA